MTLPAQVLQEIPTGIGSGIAIRQGFIRVNANFDTLYSIMTDTTTLSTAISQLEYFQMPQGTTAQIEAISSPQNGMFVFNVTTGELWYYSAGDWRILAIEN